MIKYSTLFLILFFGLNDSSLGQITGPELTEINEQRQQLNQNGMKVLAGWSVSNIIAGGIGLSQTDGRTRHFHEMNLAWNSVNLAIAGLGYYGSGSDPSTYSLSQTLREFQHFENLLLFNAGLDVGYMAMGAYLWERGLRKDSDRLKGYGQSIIIQGGFLFAFDLVLFSLSRHKSSALLKSLDGLSVGLSGVSCKMRF